MMDELEENYRMYTRVQQTFWDVGQNVKCYLQAGQILQARKHSIYNNIHVYIIYMNIRPNVYKIQHRNMLEKSPQVIICAVDANDSALCSSIAGRFAKVCIIKCNEANLHNPESY